jgi:hypothetical protein
MEFSFYDFGTKTTPSALRLHGQDVGGRGGASPGNGMHGSFLSPNRLQGPHVLLSDGY